MAIRRAWILNLDADLELGADDRYQRSRRVAAAMQPYVTQLAASLLGPGDLLVDDLSPPLVARGLPGRAFCPTPNAVATLRRAGAEPEAHPPVHVLRLVNSRAFASALGPTLPGAVFVTDLATACAMLTRAPQVGEAWRVKYAFGMTGRNQRVVARAIDAQDVAFIVRGLAQGGVQVEPNVKIDFEYAMHAVLRENGGLRTGALVTQLCDARGAWLATERVAANDATVAVSVRMHAEVERVARALHGAGYYGPFGVDAYSYTGRDGESCLQARSEINARYSMGFAVGFGDASPVR